jgi:hypothetical protein
MSQCGHQATFAHSRRASAYQRLADGRKKRKMFDPLTFDTDTKYVTIGLARRPPIQFDGLEATGKQPIEVLGETGRHGLANRVHVRYVSGNAGTNLGSIGTPVFNGSK